MKVPKLSVDFGGIQMKNPVMVASGTFGYGPEYADLVDLNRLGAIVVKGIGINPTKGNPTPRTAEVASGLMNAIGLPNPGFDGFVAEYMPFLRKHDVPAIVNIWGGSVADYAEIARRFDDVEGVAGLEINVSCPNIKEGSAVFGHDPALQAEVIGAVRKGTKLPLIVKLAPDVSDIKAFAKSAEEAGADALAIMNSYPSMAIDVATRRPKLANVTGGLSGPAIRPIAVRLVWLAAQVVKIPIVGIGGITCADDALEFLIAGASAVAVGTANFTHPPTALEVVDGISEYLTLNGHDDVGQIVGTVQV